MPIYEFRCRECRNDFEVLVLPRSPAATCPACGSAQLEQQISLAAVSSESSRSANLKAAHQRAAAVRHDRAHAEHTAHHDHFQDTPVKGGKSKKPHSH